MRWTHCPGPFPSGTPDCVMWDSPTLLRAGCRCQLSLVVCAVLLLSYFFSPNDCIWGFLKNCLTYLLLAELGLVTVASPVTATGPCSLAGECGLLIAVVLLLQGVRSRIHGLQ